MKYFSPFFRFGQKPRFFEYAAITKNGAEKLAEQSGIRRGRSPRFCVFAVYIRARDKKIFFSWLPPPFFIYFFPLFLYNNKTAGE